MSIVEAISHYINTDDPFIMSICIGILFFIFFDFYHLMFSSIFSWFKK